jgi:hypothetical protein
MRIVRIFWYFLPGTENAQNGTGTAARERRCRRRLAMDPFAPVIEAYDFARAAGLSRADAFARAIAAFRLTRPELSLGDAGREVARALLQAAVATRMAQGECAADAMPRPAISW